MARTLRQWNDRILLAWLPLVMLAGSLLLYLVLRSHVLHMEQQQLRLKADNVWQAYREANGEMPLKMAGEYEIVSLAPGVGMGDGGPTDTTFSLPVAGEHEFAYLSTLKTGPGGGFKIMTFQSSRELGHLMVKIALTETLIFLMLLVAMVLINKKAAGRLWKPFFRTIKEVKVYDIRKEESSHLEMETHVAEFNELNQNLGVLFDQVGHAYQNQKQFTENAAHELQTPLAVIRSKVELLADSMPLNEESAQLLAEIADANDRLSQMNKDLLLLARIENNQFTANETVDLSATLVRLVNMHIHLHEHAGLSMETQMDSSVLITANTHLVDVMVDNLLRNAFIHNVPGGWVKVRLKGTELDIENSGKSMNSDPHQMFERFRKGDDRSGTPGLGLSLVRQICQAHGFMVNYTMSEDVHSLHVSFRSKVS